MMVESFPSNITCLGAILFEKWVLVKQFQTILFVWTDLCDSSENIALLFLYFFLKNLTIYKAETFTGNITSIFIHCV